jgi:hypothetical protein
LQATNAFTADATADTDVASAGVIVTKLFFFVSKKATTSAPAKQAKAFTDPHSVGRIL